MSDPNTRVIEGRGRTVVPGFIDTHVHALDVASGEAAQPFVNLRSIKEVQDWLRARSADDGRGHPGSGLRGRIRPG